MATIDDIISRAQQVRDNTAVGSNTATLVGGVMTDTAEHVKQNETDIAGLTSSVSTIEAETGLTRTSTKASVTGSTYTNELSVFIPAGTNVKVTITGATGLFPSNALNLRFLDNNDSAVYYQTITLPSFTDTFNFASDVYKVKIDRTVAATGSDDITLSVLITSLFALQADLDSLTSEVSDLQQIETRVKKIESDLYAINISQSVSTVVGSSYYNQFLDLDIPANTTFRLDISGDTGLWSNNALTIRVYDTDDVQIDAHNVTYPVVDTNTYNSAVGKISVERSAHALAVGTITAVLTIDETEFYTKAQVDSLLVDAGADNSPIYVATNGLDTDDGTLAHPLATINEALKRSSTIIVRGGLYKSQTIDLSKTQSRKVNISNYNGEKPCFLNNIIGESETQTAGYTKVYQMPFATSLASYNWIFQYGVEDQMTAISDSNRTYVHARRNYRCDVTRLFRVNSIQEVEDCTAYAWYQDSGILYYSRPQSVDSTHPIFRGYGSMFSNTLGKELHLNGLRIYGKTFNITATLNSVVAECSAIGCFGGYGFQFDNSRNLLLSRCEGALVETNFTSSTGDGFNVHSTASGADGSIMLSTFSLIDCWAHDNFNDGYSDHECCAGRIVGGCYEYNSCGSDGQGGHIYNASGKVGHGGGITPSHGAHDTIDGAIVQCNFEDGVRYTSDAVIQYSSRGTFYANSVLSRNNALNGIAVNNVNQIANVVDSVSVGNGGYGFYCNENGTMNLYNCKYVGNTSGGKSAYVTEVV